jgi:SAM-dependent methyltransferase
VGARHSWREYWYQKTTSLPREDTGAFYQRQADELRLLFLSRPLRRVLELGCGNGVLYERLSFDELDYTGVDFSPSMLRIFADRHPRVRLVTCDAEDYRDEVRGYDLIFSNQLVQYFDRDMFARMLTNAVAMLAPGGYLIVGSVLWRTLRLRYYTGELTGQRANLIRRAYRIGVGLVKDQMGSWYSFGEVARLGEQYGLRSELFGSVNYPYRFHVRMTRDL